MPRLTQIPFRGPGRRVARIARPSLGLELLEERVVLSNNPTVAISQSGGTVTIQGDRADDVVSIAISGRTLTVKATSTLTVPPPALGGKPVTLTFPKTASYATVDVKKIVFLGSLGNDRFTNLTALPSDAFGEEGNDTLTGGAGNDNLDGGEGDDMLKGLGGVDHLFGGDGDDSLAGGAGSDSLRGDGGADSLDGGAGDDFIYGGEGNDSLMGGAGDDTLEADDGNDKLAGGAGDDYLNGGAGNDVFIIAVNAGADAVMEATDADLDTLDFAALPFGITIDLGSTAAQPLGQGSAVSVILSDPRGIERVIGSPFGDTIKGNARDNVLEGRGGNDTLTGGTGSDTYVFAGGSLGSDSVNEAAGVDTDTLDFSWFNVGKKAQGITLDIGSTALQNVSPGSLKLKLSNSLGIENVIGSPFKDTITGNGRDNRLLGMAGDDQLLGLGGDDFLSGGLGADSLIGGAGIDALFGGAGIDSLFGEEGSDRFLQQQHVGAGPEDVVKDASPLDAVLLFIDTDGGAAHASGEWSKASWSESEITEVDRSLSELHHRTGTPALLQKGKFAGDPLTFISWVDDVFVRVGHNYKAPTVAVGAYNTYDLSEMVFPDAAFGGTAEWRLQVIQHEIGHNYGDDAKLDGIFGAGSGKFAEFLALSGWKKASGPVTPAGYVQAMQDGKPNGWIYLATATFASDYGRGVPGDDFATSFESGIARWASRTWVASNPVDVPDKWAFIDAMIAKLSTRSFA